jgi:hypothetical protein
MPDVPVYLDIDGLPPGLTIPPAFLDTAQALGRLLAIVTADGGDEYARQLNALTTRIERTSTANAKSMLLLAVLILSGAKKAGPTGETP